MASLTDLIMRHEKSPLGLAAIISVPITALVLVLLISLSVWDESVRQRLIREQLRTSALAYFEQVLLERRWVSEHGGVYVEVTADTRPSPYLEDPERDIVSTEGKKYTRIDPSFMNRQMSELARESGNYRFRLTSLKAINPINGPDEWEARMLRSFEEGMDEGYGVVEYEGRDYFRFMAPLRMEKDCLGCHLEQGYGEGDIGGGLSISIPTAAIVETYKGLSGQSRMVFGIIGFLALFLVGVISWVFSKRLAEAISREVEAEKLKSAVYVAGAAAHEMRQPMTVISGFAEIVIERARKGEAIGDELQIIVDQCFRLNRIITRMLNVSDFKTKSYGHDSEIFDLGLDEEARSPSSSGRPGEGEENT